MTAFFSKATEDFQLKVECFRRRLQKPLMYLVALSTPDHFCLEGFEKALDRWVITDVAFPLLGVIEPCFREISGLRYEQ